MIMNKLATVLGILIFGITLFNIHKLHEVNSKLEDFYFVDKYEEPEPEIIFLDSLIYDTVFIETTEIVKLPIYDTVFCTDTLKIQEKVQDSIFVEVPISVKHYKDTLAETAFSFDLRGYNCKVDKLYVQNLKTPTIEENKPKRWGIGVQLGVGGCKDGFSPYFGVGLNYDLVQF